MAKINLYAQSWCDLVFANKNKEYGAYEMRKLSGRRHLLAIVIVILVCSLGLSLPAIIETVASKMKKKEVVVEVTSLADIKVDVPKEDVIKEFTPPPPPLKSTIKFTAPVIAKDEEVPEDEEMKTQEELAESESSISIRDVVGTDEEAGLDIADIIEIVEEVSTVEKPYQFVEEMPEFPGGDDAFRKYVQKNLMYPPIAIENGIKGMVIVNFIVSPDGKISNIKVLRGLDRSCDTEAIRVISKMPPWKPGRQNGKPVFVQFSLPIRFDLTNN